MTKRLLLLAVLGISLIATVPASAAIQAPDDHATNGDATTPACTSPPPVQAYAW